MELVTLVQSPSQFIRVHPSLKDRITDREKEVLRNIANGATSQEIADDLYISHHTVISHRKNLLIKLDARNTAHLIMIGVRLGLLPTF